jgi:hypothetical protein
LPHVPLAPLPFFAVEHALHAPVHELLQHTPSTQYPLWHWLALVQALPFAFLEPQTPLSHTVPPTHWVSLAQLVPQALPAQA